MLKDMCYTAPECSTARNWVDDFNYEPRARRQQLKLYGYWFAQWLQREKAKSTDALKVWEWVDTVGGAGMGLGLGSDSLTVDRKLCDIQRNAFGGGRDVLHHLLATKDASMGTLSAAHYRDVDKFGTTWRAVPWAREDWFTYSAYRHTHALHIATGNELQVAYAQTLPKVVGEKYVSTKPGRYLTQFFGHVLDETQIKYWAEQVSAAAAPCELHFIEGADTEGWLRVYRDGPDSCMKGENTVRVYSHKNSVLRLAYITQGDEIKGRAIVREDEHQYVRVYPNTNSTDGQRYNTVMRDMVEAAGYGFGSLMGVLLDAIPHKGDEGGYICPYLDSGDGDTPCLEVTYVHGKEYLRVGRNGMDGQTQNGYVSDYDENSRDCDDCGERCPEDEMRFIECNDHHVCECCMQENYVMAYGRRSQVLVRTDDMELVEVGGEWYMTEYANNHDIYLCDVTEEWMHEDDMVMTKRGYISQNEAVHLGVEDSEGNEWAYAPDTVQTHDGRTIHEDDAVEVEVSYTCHKNDNVDEVKERKVA